MVSVFDVAKYILGRTGPISAMKLQKLVYYCQAWFLVWADCPMFREKIFAFAYGPVVYDLFKAHQRLFKVQSSTFPKGSAAALSPEQKKSVDAVVNFYGGKSSQWLSDLTHMERPWIEARAGLSSEDPGYREISLATMQQYYASLPRK